MIFKDYLDNVVFWHNRNMSRVNFKYYINTLDKCTFNKSRYLMVGINSEPKYRIIDLGYGSELFVIVRVIGGTMLEKAIKASGFEQFSEETLNDHYPKKNIKNIKIYDYTSGWYYDNDLNQRIDLPDAKNVLKRILNKEE